MSHIKWKIVQCFVSFSEYRCLWRFTEVGDFKKTLRLNRVVTKPKRCHFAILVVGRWACMTGWWFQICFIFTPIWGIFPFWLIFFQMGWFNHQPDDVWQRSLIIIDFDFEGWRWPNFSSRTGWWQLKDFLNFHPENWGDHHFFDEYFSDGLVQPPTRQVNLKNTLKDTQFEKRTEVIYIGLSLCFDRWMLYTFHFMWTASSFDMKDWAGKRRHEVKSTCCEENTRSLIKYWGWRFWSNEHLNFVPKHLEQAQAKFGAELFLHHMWYILKQWEISNMNRQQKTTKTSNTLWVGWATCRQFLP